MNKKNPFESYNQPLVEEDIPGLADMDMGDDAVILETTRENQCETCKVTQEAEEVRLRALAEMENFKKRLQREQEEQAAYATEKVLADLLPTLDNFDLALQYGNQVEICKDVLMGVEMTRKLLLDAIKNHGMEPVGKEGEPFDPNLHEAMGQEENAALAPGTILKVMMKGYKLKDRLVRPAKVIINSFKGNVPHDQGFRQSSTGGDSDENAGGRCLRFKV